MKSRLAATAVLMIVLAMVVAAPSFALSGASGGGNAASAQYPHYDPHHRLHIPPAPPRHVVQAHSSSLPFTGYAAIPVLLGGVALLGAGLAVRRRTGGGLGS